MQKLISLFGQKIISISYHLIKRFFKLITFNIFDSGFFEFMKRKNHLNNIQNNIQFRQWVTDNYPYPLFQYE